MWFTQTFDYINELIIASWLNVRCSKDHKRIIIYIKKRNLLFFIVHFIDLVHNCHRDLVCDHAVIILKELQFHYAPLLIVPWNNIHRKSRANRHMLNNFIKFIFIIPYKKPYPKSTYNHNLYHPWTTWVFKLECFIHRRSLIFIWLIVLINSLITLEV